MKNNLYNPPTAEVFWVQTEPIALSFHDQNRTEIFSRDEDEIDL